MSVIAPEAPRALYLRVDDVAGMLDTTPDTVRRLLAKGEIQGLKIGGQWRVHRSTIEDLAVVQADGATVSDNVDEEQ
jgi:excisionase family DNA binding protein